MCNELSSKEKKIVKSLSAGTAANNGQTIVFNFNTKKYEFVNPAGGGDALLNGENIFTGNNLFSGDFILQGSNVFESNVLLLGENSFASNNFFANRPFIGTDSAGDATKQVATLGDLSNYATLDGEGQFFQSPIYVGSEAGINNELLTRAQVSSQFETYDNYIQAALNSKANTSALANYATTTALTNGLAGKVDTATLANYATTASLANYAAKATTNTFTMLQTFSRAIANSGGTNANFGININYSINNTGGTNTMSGIFVNATETALSGTTHNLIDLQVASSSKFSVRNDGYLITGSAIQAATFLQGNALRFTSFGRIQPASDGVFTFAVNAGVESGFNRIQLGGTTNAFPSIKRNSASIDFRLADDSGYATIQANAIIAYSLIRCAASTSTVASLNIPAGTAPTTPNESDIWNGGDGNLYMRIGGATKRFTMS
jgi:hypothetical protein